MNHKYELIKCKNESCANESNVRMNQMDEWIKLPNESNVRMNQMYKLIKLMEWIKLNQFNWINIMEWMN